MGFKDLFKSSKEPATGKISRDQGKPASASTKNGDSPAEMEAANHSNYDRTLEEILADGGDLQASLVAVLMRDGNEIVLKELAVNGPPTVKETAIALLNDKTFMKKIKKTGKPEDTGKNPGASKKVRRPVYYEYGPHMDCPECLSPMIINGPLRKKQCDSCGSEVSIDLEFWKGLFRMSPTGGVWITGQRVGHMPGKLKTPHCPDCSTALDTDNIAIGSDSIIKCPSCNKEHLTYPAPEWLAKCKKDDIKLKPVQVYCAEKEDGSSPQLEVRPHPIAFSCINCGGNLELNMESLRIVFCSYCDTQQFLPGALWYALHPAKKLRRWYVRYG